MPSQNFGILVRSKTYDGGTIVDPRRGSYRGSRSGIEGRVDSVTRRLVITDWFTSIVVALGWSSPMQWVGLCLLQALVHDGGSEALKLGTNERLGHAVSNHLISWAVLDLYRSLLHLISNKEISDLDVSGSLADTFVAILLQLDSTLIIL